MARVQRRLIAETKRAANPHESSLQRQIQVLASNFVEVRVLSWAPTVAHAYGGSGH